MKVEPTRSTFRVRYAETDQMGVVYHSHYLIWCEIGRTDHIRRFGTSYADMEKRGLTLAVAEASIRYLAPARYDDPIEVSTTLTEVRSRSVTFAYEITNADTGIRLASASTKLVALDPSGRITTIADDLRSILASAAA